MNLLTALSIFAASHHFASSSTNDIGMFVVIGVVLVVGLVAAVVHTATKAKPVSPQRLA